MSNMPKQINGSKVKSLTTPRDPSASPYYFPLPSAAPDTIPVNPIPDNLPGAGPRYFPLPSVAPDTIPSSLPEDTIESPAPYLVQPVFKSDNIALPAVAVNPAIKDIVSADKGSIDQDKQAFVNVATITEIKSVADKNGQYDAEKVEAAAQDVADYYTARAALDAKFGKVYNDAEPGHDDKTQTVMDAGYEAALAELNKQYDEDTVDLYNETKEKIDAYEEAERKHSKYLNTEQDGIHMDYRFAIPNPDYDSNFAKNDPDLADVAYAKGEMSADDYKAVSGTEYTSDDPEKPYVKTEAMASAAVVVENDGFAIGVDKDRSKLLADAFKEAVSTPSAVALGTKAVELNDKILEDSSKVSDTMENSSAQTNVARGHEFDGQFDSTDSVDLSGLSV